MLTAESKCRLRRVEQLEVGTTQISPAVSLASNTQGVVKSSVDALCTERVRVVSIIFVAWSHTKYKVPSTPTTCICITF